MKLYRTVNGYAQTVVETPRPSYRQQQAQMTKDRIVAAARVLMAERGWAGATIDAIAEQAGVATQTVYSAFGNKRAIVDAMREVMLRDSEVPQLMAKAAAAPDVRERLRLWAKLIRQQMETSYDIIAIHRQAAMADAEFAAAYRGVLDNRGRSFSDFVKQLRTQLGEGMEASTATDLLWALANEELYRELVVERGWSLDRYEHWLAETLIAQLVDQPVPSPPRRPRKR